MWALTRLAEFNRAFHASDATWSPQDCAASLQFPQGLLFSLLLVTPFWTVVGLVLYHVAK
ncbi:MAG TPA: hypothetical protein VL240_08390 [Candidatus Binatia bacterium]|nr:hypothetical protein [Candidatus Binatia bacterium]